MPGMYSTKEMFPKKVTSSIYSGDAFIKKQIKPSRVLGKQFAIAATGMIFSVPEFKSDPIQFGEKFSVTQPAANRKLGFGSKNASLSGEFTSNYRTSQYREILKKELLNERKTKAALEKKNGRNPKLNTDTNVIAKKKFFGYVNGRPMSDRTHDRVRRLFQRNVPTLLCDIGREDSNGVTLSCNRCARDTFFCRHRQNSENLCDDFDSSANAKSTPRITGPYMVSSEQYGNFEAAAVRPQHGRRHTTMEFFDTIRGGSLVA